MPNTRIQAQDFEVSKVDGRLNKPSVREEEIFGRESLVFGCKRTVSLITRLTVAFGGATVLEEPKLAEASSCCACLERANSREHRLDSVELAFSESGSVGVIVDTKGF